MKKRAAWKTHRRCGSYHAVPAGPLSYPSCRITRHTLTGETNRLRTCCTCPYEKERDQWILIPAQTPTAYFRSTRNWFTIKVYLVHCFTALFPLLLLKIRQSVFDIHYTTYLTWTDVGFNVGYTESIWHVSLKSTKLEKAEIFQKRCSKSSLTRTFDTENLEIRQKQRFKFPRFPRSPNKLNDPRFSSNVSHWRMFQLDDMDQRYKASYLAGSTLSANNNQPRG